MKSICIALGCLLIAGEARAQITTEALLDSVQHTAFEYFWNEANPANGLIKDRNTSGSPCSIASVGFGLSAICIGIDHGWITRDQGRARVRTTLETFWNYPQGPDASGFIGYKGLYYHFLDMTTGLRTWDSELSTIDTALLFAGILHARQYFTSADSIETRIRALADSIYQRADWNFMRNLHPAILMGWKPVTGFSGFGEWRGYNEAMILYILALGSPTHAVPTTCWGTWTSTYSWQTLSGQTYVIFPPLFGHQYSHCWVDFRYIQDPYMQGKGITYFENSRRATLAQRAYAIANPEGYRGYGERLWGLSACDGPLDGTVTVGGRAREFHTYQARGASFTRVTDDGTIAPTAAAASIAFAPELVIPTLIAMRDDWGEPLFGRYGFLDALNPTLDVPASLHHGRVVAGRGWFDTDYLGIDQGPILAMIENHRTGLVWRTMRRNLHIVRGLERAGFSGGWLDSAAAGR